MRLEARSDRALIRAGGNSIRYVRLFLIAPPSPRRAERWPVNVALVLDRSGSMGGRKIELARDATAQALRLLRADDRFALVVYDNEVSLLSESVEATPQVKRRALERLAQIGARGTTDLSGGWLRGGEQLVGTLMPRAIGRCLLLTDGLANQGITDRNELVPMAAGLRTQGVSTSTFGVGDDFDERLLRGMAEASGGNFYFIEAPEQIPDLLASELGETLEIVARDVILDVALAPGMSAEPLNRFRWERTADHARIELGHLVSNQELEVVVKLAFPPGEAGREVAATVAVVDPAGAIEPATAEVRWTWANHEGNDGQARDRDVDFAVATLYAGRARDEAVEHNREGSLEAARRVLRATARRIREYAGDEPRLRGLVDQLEAEAEEYGSRAFGACELKQASYGNYVAEMSREPSGKARRRSRRGADS
jgi:Ca-activated chloride channel homolog